MPGLIKKKIKNVLLMYPPGKVLRGRFHHCQIPMGLAYLAAVIRDDFNVKIFDARAKAKRIKAPKDKWDYYGYSFAEIEEIIKKSAPDVVGITCLYSYVYPEVRKLCELIKKINPRIITVIGGSHPTFLADSIMKENLSLDFIILGEGEASFLRLLRELNSGQDYRTIDGIAFRNNGSYVKNPKTGFIKELDVLPFPAFDLLPLDFYEKNAVPFSATFRSKKNMPILTSRGCTAQCIFCASRNYWGNNYRTRSAENVLDELEYRVNKYKIREIQFIDDNLTLDKKRACEIFKGIIDRKLNIYWNTPNGIALWTLDRPMLELMRKSGCYELTVAFESGDQEVLNKIIKKPLDLKKASGLVASMKELGIQVHAFFISGFPGETKTQILKTFSFAEEMDLDGAWFFMANPTPGSELYEIGVRNGYITNSYNFDEIYYNLPHFNSENISSQEMEKMVLKQFNVFLLKILLRHPVRFLKKYLRLFLVHPVKSIRTTMVDVVKIMRKDA